MRTARGLRFAGIDIREEVGSSQKNNGDSEYCWTFRVPSKEKTFPIFAYTKWQELPYTPIERTGTLRSSKPTLYICLKRRIFIFTCVPYIDNFSALS